MDREESGLSQCDLDSDSGFTEQLVFMGLSHGNMVKSHRADKQAPNFKSDKKRETN